MDTAPTLIGLDDQGIPVGYEFLGGAAFLGGVYKVTLQPGESTMIETNVSIP